MKKLMLLFAALFLSYCSRGQTVKTYHTNTCIVVFADGSKLSSKEKHRFEIHYTDVGKIWYVNMYNTTGLEDVLTVQKYLADDASADAVAKQYLMLNQDGVYCKLEVEADKDMFIIVYTSGDETIFFHTDN